MNKVMDEGDLDFAISALAPLRDCNEPCCSGSYARPEINRLGGANGPGRPSGIETATTRLNPPLPPCPSSTARCSTDLETSRPPTRPSRRATRRPTPPPLGPLRLLPSPLAVLISFLLLQSQLNLVRLADGARATEVDIDWSPTSELFNKGSRRIATRYVRMKEVLHFRCPLNGFYAIMMVPEEAAHRCHIDPAAAEETAKEIGMCGPNTGDPKVGVRPYSPIPGRPTFNTGESYYLITTSNGSESGLLNAEGGLCASNGMRLRLSVLSASTRQRPSDSIDPFTSPHETASTESEDGSFEIGEEKEKPSTTPPPASTTTGHPPRSKVTGVNAVQQIRRVTVKPTSAPSTSTTTAMPVEETTKTHVMGSANGFPAILTLEQNGEKRRVIVNTAEELEWEIQRANEENGERVNGIEGIHPSSLPAKANTRPSEADLNRSEYEHVVSSSVEETPRTHGGSTLQSIPPPPAPPITASNQFPRSRWTNHPRNRPKGYPNTEPKSQGGEAQTQTGSGGNSSPLRRNVAPTNPESDPHSQGHQVHEPAKAGRSMPILYVVGYDADEAGGSAGQKPTSSGSKLAPLTTLLCVTMIALLAIFVGQHWHYWLR